MFAASLLGLSLWLPNLAAAADDTAPPTITHVHVRSASIGEPILIRVRFDDDSAIFAPALYFRAQGEDRYNSIPLERGQDAFEAAIPAEAAAANVEYFIEAFDEHGNGPAREGTPESPIGVAVFDPSDGPPPLPGIVVPDPDDNPDIIADPDTGDDKSGGSVFGRWWFWTIVGVAAAGAGAGIYLATQGGPIDFVAVNVEGMDPTGGLQ